MRFTVPIAEILTIVFVILMATLAFPKASLIVFVTYAMFVGIMIGRGDIK